MKRSRETDSVEDDVAETLQRLDDRVARLQSGGSAQLAGMQEVTACMRGYVRDLSEAVSKLQDDARIADEVVRRLSATIRPLHTKVTGIEAAPSEEKEALHPLLKAVADKNTRASEGAVSASVLRILSLKEEKKRQEMQQQLYEGLGQRGVYTHTPTHRAEVNKKVVAAREELSSLAKRRQPVIPDAREEGVEDRDDSPLPAPRKPPPKNPTAMGRPAGIPRSTYPQRPIMRLTREQLVQERQRRLQETNPYPLRDDKCSL